MIIVPAAITFVAGIGIGSNGFSFAQKSKDSDPPGRYVVPLSTYRLPDTMSFCGERIPLEIPDVRQRMEWAFYIDFDDGQIMLDLKRSTEYFPYIEQKLRDMGMPQDLKYLPVAESALRNLVSSRGAAGLWQFTPDAARHYGLIVNGYVDERYNFRKATVASLKYLSDLYARFRSWALAAAAYNMGSSGLTANINYQHVDNYYDLYLNDETSRFVFRIVALKQIMSHYKQYGFDLTPEDFYPPPDTKLVVVTSISDLSSWARGEGSSFKEVKELNPWIVGRILPYGTWEVELPKYAQPLIFTSPAPTQQTILQQPDSSGTGTAKREVTYVVKRGDSLDRIAAEFGISVSDLIQWNDLTDRGYLVAGQKLIILVQHSDTSQ